ncbi:extracellular matrix/biofilm biosynthesis regulator RemA family protein [Proteinivorax hydrogeniformans]|uniref:Extracellular matrix/biofilm biosynthesis regulator RemA family protein n=1 Tax=Proteinivorax hydrogeniformans TaxID=1826727 RepID=A0AAU8HT49_9FIRM
MFLHLGGNIVISLKGVVGIFDYSLNETSQTTNNYLNFEKDKEVIKIAENGDYKSFIITNNKIYLSPIATSTLKKRISSEKFIDKINILQDDPTLD